MKRYWKIITLPAVILFTFMIYYLYPIIVKEELFELELVTEQDTENIAENLTILGDVYEREQIEGEYHNNASYDSFELSSDGMTYLNQLSYFERLNNLHPHPKMEQLKQDYRSFMRGKDSIELVYEDEASLAYVGPFGQDPEGGAIQLNVSVLDKQADEVQNFTVEVPLEGPMQFVNITDVQLLNEKLYVLTNHYGQQTEEYFYLYQIDLAEGILEESHHLSDFSGKDFWIANDYYGIEKKTHYVFRKHEEMEDSGSDGYSSTFISYHIETGEINEITFPDGWTVYSDLEESEVNPYTIGNYAIKDEFMYFIQFTEEKLLIDQYNLLDKELEATEELVFEAETIEGLNLVYTEGDKVSLISTTAAQGLKERAIFVIDLKNAEVIYEGDIDITNTSKELHVYEIGFYQMYID